MNAHETGGMADPFASKHNHNKPPTPAKTIKRKISEVFEDDDLTGYGARVAYQRRILDGKRVDGRETGQKVRETTAIDEAKSPTTSRLVKVPSIRSPEMKIEHSSTELTAQVIFPARREADGTATAQNAAFYCEHIHSSAQQQERVHHWLDEVDEDGEVEEYQAYDETADEALSHRDNSPPCMRPIHPW